jgi:hypothetical protein
MKRYIGRISEATAICILVFAVPFVWISDKLDPKIDF